jgi:general secretion pathway protein E/type IV pilus assembly protein PilB
MNDVLKFLAQDGVLDDVALAKVQTEVANGTLLEDALKAHANEEKALRSLAAHFEVPYVELGEFQAPKEFFAKFPARVLLDHHILPMTEEDGVVTVATSRLFDTSGIDELRLTTGHDFRPALAPTQEIDRAMKRLLGVGADTLQQMGEEGGIRVLESENEDLDLSKAAEDATIIRFVNQILSEALESRATDVHIEPFEEQLRVRYRVDGNLVETPIPAEVRKYHAAIVSRIKILSHLDIAEKRIPQDGRIRVRVAGRDIDLRVSVIPMIHGEAVVLRILDRGDMKFGLEYLGMSERDNELLHRVLGLPHGIVLVTGPTGSGKTTTLYAGLSKINTNDLKIITVEDPVEYQLPGINQIQVNTKTGLTFGAGLRAILRHDPDVVLIGEIRDKETAEIAVQASLTGHLVFSTLHTNDAPGAATRMIDMGVEPYLIASSVELVLAQRLVRVICKHCKEETPKKDLDKLRLKYGDLVPDVVYRGHGCRNCLGTGFRGRQGVFEMMPMTEEIRALVMQHASAGAIRKVAIEQGMKSLRQDGWRLVQLGKTTIEEIVFATKDEADLMINTVDATHASVNGHHEAVPAVAAAGV